eukprot:4169224-Prymnesium_polylepis.1
MCSTTAATPSPTSAAATSTLRCRCSGVSGGTYPSPRGVRPRGASASLPHRRPRRQNDPRSARHVARTAVATETVALTFLELLGVHVSMSHVSQYTSS